MAPALLAAAELVTTTGVELELPPPPQADTNRPMAASEANFSVLTGSKLIARMVAPL